MDYKSFFKYLWEGRHGRFWSAYWMDSRGMFHEVYRDEDGRAGHFRFAREYCDTHNIDYSRTGPIEELFKRGWVRVTFNYGTDNELHFDYGVRSVSDSQLKSLKVKATELGALSIFDDKQNKDIEF